MRTTRPRSYGRSFTLRHGVALYRAGTTNPTIRMHEVGFTPANRNELSFSIRVNYWFSTNQYGRPGAQELITSYIQSR